MRLCGWWKKQLLRAEVNLSRVGLSLPPVPKTPHFLGLFPATSLVRSFPFLPHQWTRLTGIAHQARIPGKACILIHVFVAVLSLVSLLLHFLDPDGVTPVYAVQTSCSLQMLSDYM